MRPLLGLVNSGRRIDSERINRLKEIISACTEELRAHIKRVLLYQKALAIKETLLEVSKSIPEAQAFIKNFRTTLKGIKVDETEALLELLQAHDKKDSNWVRTCSTILALLKAAENNKKTADIYKKVKIETFAKKKELNLRSSSERFPKLGSNSSPIPIIAPLPHQKLAPVPSKAQTSVWLETDQDRASESGFAAAFADDKPPLGLTMNERNSLTAPRSSSINTDFSSISSVDDLDMEDDPEA